VRGLGVSSLALASRRARGATAGNIWVVWLRPVKQAWQRSTYSLVIYRISYIVGDVHREVCFAHQCEHRDKATVSNELCESKISKTGQNSAILAKSTIRTVSNEFSEDEDGGRRRDTGVNGRGPEVESCWHRFKVGAARVVSIAVKLPTLADLRQYTSK
jgi:hypothetical protein